MPVDLPSLHGKCEYEVETAIKTLAAAVNSLEGTPTAAQLADIRRLANTAQAAVTDLTQRFDRLYGACHTAGII